jgi:hypothetical protein
MATALTTWRLLGWSGAAALLLMPLAAMRMTAEVRWDGADFLLFGAMLLVAGGSIELAGRALTTRGARIMAAAGAIAAFLLVWAELAVGILH